MASAREAGLDLVEVAPQSRPPVCRIMDYGKWKYALKKKERKARARRHETELKEVRIRTPKIGQHDLQIKIDHARQFLLRGDRVQFTMWFRGREMAHQELGREMLNTVKAALGEVAKVERDMGMEGRSLTMLLSPLPKVVKGTKAQAGEAGKAPRPQPAAPAAETPAARAPAAVEGSPPAGQVSPASGPPA